MKRLRHHPRLIVGALVVLLALGVLGYAARRGTPSYRPRAGFSCVFHGWGAWRTLHHHHPLWTGYHLWRASRTCRPAPWRY